MNPKTPQGQAFDACIDSLIKNPAASVMSTLVGFCRDWDIHPDVIAFAVPDTLKARLEDESKSYVAPHMRRNAYRSEPADDMESSELRLYQSDPIVNFTSRVKVCRRKKQVKRSIRPAA